MNRVKFLLKKHNFSAVELADKINITYPAFNKNLNNPSLKTLKTLQDLTKIPIIEFLEAPDGFAHFYDDKTGEWLGIRKK